MNIRKPVDYGAMYAALDKLVAAELSQMKLYYGIGELISCRTEKGAAVAASEYLQSAYPDEPGFSPRNLRRMRDLYRIYENHPELAALAMKLGWTQNLVIMDADLTMEERRWYLIAAKRFGWSKAELTAQIHSAAHLSVALDIGEIPCYNEHDKEITENEDEKDTFRLSWECVSQSDGRVRDEGSGEESRIGERVLHRIGSHQYRGTGQSCPSWHTQETGRTWDLLRGQDRTAAQEQRLRKVRSADWNGPGQPPQYVPNLRWGLCRQDAPPTGLYRPSRRGGRSLVHWGLRGYLAGCAGWMPGTAA